MGKPNIVVSFIQAKTFTDEDVTRCAKFLKEIEDQHRRDPLNWYRYGLFYLTNLNSSQFVLFSTKRKNAGVVKKLRELDEKFSVAEVFNAYIEPSLYRILINSNFIQAYYIRNLWKLQSEAEWLDYQDNAWHMKALLRKDLPFASVFTKNFGLDSILIPNNDFFPQKEKVIVVGKYESVAFLYTNLRKGTSLEKIRTIVKKYMDL